MDATFVDAAHANGLVVHPYTVDDPTEVTQLLGLGVDGMFTNVPEQLLAVATTSGSPPVPAAACAADR